MIEWQVGINCCCCLTSKKPCQYPNYCGSFCKVAKKLKLILFFEMCTFASYVFVSKNRAKVHGISLFLVMESHEKSWNLKCQKE